MASEAPERIWAFQEGERWNRDFWQKSGHPLGTEYIRADLATLSSDAVAGGEEVEEFEPYSLVDKAQAWDMLTEKNKVIASLEAQLAERVKVKQLEWAYDSHTSQWWANGAVGQYQVWEIHGHAFFNPSTAAGGSVDEAKAAAQADYERRILSAIED